jgi:hypothetical protein
MTELLLCLKVVIAVGMSPVVALPPLRFSTKLGVLKLSSDHGPPYVIIVDI